MNKKNKCPGCLSSTIIRYGNINDEQRYLCKDCGLQFTENCSIKSQIKKLFYRAIISYLLTESALEQYASEKFFSSNPSDLYSCCRYFFNIPSRILKKWDEEIHEILLSVTSLKASEKNKLANKFNQNLNEKTNHLEKKFKL